MFYVLRAESPKLPCLTLLGRQKMTFSHKLKSEKCSRIFFLEKNFIKFEANNFLEFQKGAVLFGVRAAQSS